MYNKISDQPCIIPLPSLGLLKLEGPDATTFLQGQLTCDVNHITDAQYQLGLFCNLQGRIITSMECFKFHDAYYMSMPADMVEITRQKLSQYIIFSKATLEDASNHLNSVGIVSKTGLPDFEFNNNNTAISNQLIALKYAENIFQLTAQKDSLDEYLKKYFPNAAVQAETHWHLLALQRGIPTISAETSEKYLPQALGFEELGAISFDKGCYIGQEIIARMHYRGKRLHNPYRVILKSDHKLFPGMKLLVDNKPAIDLIDCEAINEDEYFGIVACKAQYCNTVDANIDESSIKLKWLSEN